MNRFYRDDAPKPTRISHEKLARDVARFLAKGGQVQEIPSYESRPVPRAKGRDFV